VCEFCIRHGEGKKWYLQMKNYAKELLMEELTQEQREASRCETRLEWNLRFFKDFVVGDQEGEGEMNGAEEPSSNATGSREEELTSEQLLARRKAVHFGQVLPIEDVERVIDMVDSITRLPCGCRYISTGKSDKRYCFGLGVDRLRILGKYPDSSSSLEVLGREEAKEVFRRFDKEGLIHSIWTGVTPYVVGLCNCDRDCLAYKSYIEEMGEPRFFKAEYVCEVDLDLCNGCKSCISQCQFGSQFYSSLLSRVYIDPARCFGCGVCRAACPSAAIRLVPREQHPVAQDNW
jgi:ferredoxin